MIGGDSESVRRLARQVRTERDAVQGEASTLRAARGVQWHSTAAAHFQQTLEQRSRDLLGLVGRFEELDHALDHLASTLEQRQQLLLAAYREAKELAEAGLDAVEQGVDGAVDAAEDAGRAAWKYADDAGGWIRDHAGGLF